MKPDIQPRHDDRFISATMRHESRCLFSEEILSFHFELGLALLSSYSGFFCSRTFPSGFMRISLYFLMIRYFSTSGSFRFYSYADQTRRPRSFRSSPCYGATPADISASTFADAPLAERDKRGIYQLQAVGIFYGWPATFLLYEH